MLAGTTFAWYTDSVTSSGNKIIAGSLDIQLLKYDGSEYVDISNSGAPIFQSANLAQNNTATLWEPGKTQVAYLRLKNNGDLNLKYSVALDVKNVAKNLYEVMRYAIVKDANNDSPVNAWVPANGIPVEPGTQSTQAVNVPMAPGAVHDFALVIHMQEEAGNEYMAGEVDFDLHVLATQDTVEFDSFGPTYDANAQYPIVSTASFTMSAAPTEDLTVTSTGDIKSATVPYAAAESIFENLTADVPADSSTEVTLNLNVAKTGETGTPENVTTYLDIDMNAVVKITSATGAITTTSAAVESLTGYSVIEYFLGTGYDNVIAKHNGNAMDALANADAVPTSAAGGYYYNPSNGILTIKTKSFSPYTVTYNSVAQNTTKGDYYGSLAEAFEKASAGDRVALLKAFDAVTATKAVTIDLNGNNVGTLTAAANINVTGNGSVALSVNDGCTATVIGGQHESISFSGEGASVVAGGSYRAANVAAAKAKITASGAYILGPDSSNWHNYTLANGDFLILNPDGTEKGLYDTLYTACDNTVAGGTLKFLANTAVTYGDSNPANNDIFDLHNLSVVDFGGKTFTYNQSSSVSPFTANGMPKFINGSVVVNTLAIASLINNKAGFAVDGVTFNFNPVYCDNNNAVIKLPANIWVTDDGHYTAYTENLPVAPQEYTAKLVRFYDVVISPASNSPIPVSGNVTYYFTGANGVANAIAMVEPGETITVRGALNTNVSASNFKSLEQSFMVVAENNAGFPNPAMIITSAGEFQVTDNGNGKTYTVKKSYDYEVNGTQYENLASAYAAASATNALKLLRDVEWDSTLAVDKNLKLDLNGHTITYTGESYTKAIRVNSSNKITIVDGPSNNSGGGIIHATGTGAGGSCVFAYTAKSGKIDIYGGTFSTGGNYALGNGIFTIYGGTFICSNSSNYCQNSTAPTLSGGTIQSTNNGGTYTHTFVKN